MLVSIAGITPGSITGTVVATATRVGANGTAVTLPIRVGMDEYTATFTDAHASLVARSVKVGERVTVTGTFMNWAGKARLEFWGAIQTA